MRLYPLETNFVLYKSGFEGDDFFGRGQAGRSLSDLVEKVDDPLVVAVDGAWGTGKSYFLRRWVGAHKNENGGKADLIYFDAFAYDFIEDPLIALTGAIGDRLPPEREGDKWEKIKQIAAKLARPAFRIGVTAATAGVSDLAGPVLDEVVGAAGKEAEAAAEEFWKREDGRRAAMAQFRKALADLTSPEGDSSDGKKIVVVIDELDRCRPDYALSILEVIKHFFSVSGVHFVLGVNLKSLEGIVRTRYGYDADAGGYLKRFIHVTMQLPDFIGDDRKSKTTVSYFRIISKDMGVDSKIIDTISKQLEFLATSGRLSLRDVERIVTRLVLLPKGSEMPGFLSGWQLVATSLLLMKVVSPDLYALAVSKRLKIDDVADFYSISTDMINDQKDNSGVYDRSAYIQYNTWLFVISDSVQDDTDYEMFAQSFDSFGMRSVEHVVESLDRDMFGLFSVNG